MNDKKFIFFALFLSLFLHFVVIFFLFYDLKQNNIEFGGIQAKLGENFESVIIVSNLPVGEFKEMAINQQKAQKQEKKELKKPKEQYFKEEENAKIKIKKVKEYDKNEVEKELNHQNSLASNFTSTNSLSKDESISAPLQEQGQKTQTTTLGDSKTLIKSYQGLIMAHLAKFKKYPLQALNDKKEGVVTLFIRIDSRGNVLMSSIRKTSSVESLDKAGLELVFEASPLPKPPLDLFKGKEDLSFSLPLNYNLKHELTRN